MPTHCWYCSELIEPLYDLEHDETYCPNCNATIDDTPCPDDHVTDDDYA